MDTKCDTPLSTRAAQAFIAKLKELCPDMDGWEDASEEDRQLATACMEAALEVCGMGEMLETLNSMASWDEGDVVTGGFDEPGAAQAAREVLGRLGMKQMEFA